MKLTSINLALWFLTTAFFVGMTPAQKKDVSTTTTDRAIIFAVTEGGKLIEPIGIVNNGRFETESEEPDDAATFASKYYKSKTNYPLIFGGVAAGTVTVVKSNVGTDCGGSSADVTVKSPTAKLSRMVMGLASDLKFVPDRKGYRRMPTAAERSEVEALVRSVFRKEGAPAAAVRNLRYHNLTAVDVEGDGVPEFIGTYWIASSSKERRLLYFIAERRTNGPLIIAHSDHSIVKPDDLMSGDLKDLEGGVVSELLIDLLDYDNDGVKEVFTMVMAFEGNNYHVYKRDAGTWKRVRETYVYRCAY